METSAHVTDAYDWRERTLIGSRGERIGVVQAVYVDRVTRRLDWALVHTGRFLRKATFVPLAGARATGEAIRVRHPREEVRAAPALHPNEALSTAIEAEVFSHYGLRYERAADAGTRLRLHTPELSPTELARPRPVVG